MADFKPRCRPLLIGSIPLADPEAAVELVLRYTPEIPIWPQLPLRPQEKMIPQFLPGLPGLTQSGDRIAVQNSGDTYDQELVSFYETYMALTEGVIGLEDAYSRIEPDMAKGLYALLRRLDGLSPGPSAVKGQVTGPITLCMGTKDAENRAIFYDAQLRDAAVKLLTLKARWQIQRLGGPERPVIIFIDEPGLAGFGSSEMISISAEEIHACLSEVIEGIHAEGGLAGIHVCANTDWGMVMDTGVDIVNFDAFAYFDRFILFSDHIRRFIQRGGMVAWGIVPTLNAEDIEKENAASLTARFEEEVSSIASIGFDPKIVKEQSFITPACGVGSLTLSLAERVLSLTREVSDSVRADLSNTK